MGSGESYIRTFLSANRTTEEWCCSECRDGKIQSLSRTLFIMETSSKPYARVVKHTRFLSSLFSKTV